MLYTSHYLLIIYLHLSLQSENAVASIGGARKLLQNPKIFHPERRVGTQAAGPDTRTNLQSLPAFRYLAKMPFAASQSARGSIIADHKVPWNVGTETTVASANHLGLPLYYAPQIILEWLLVVFVETRTWYGTVPSFSAMRLAAVCGRKRHCLQATVRLLPTHKVG